LVTQVVARRTREIGIRVALGARESQVVGMILTKTLRPVASGAAIGGLGAIAVSSLLARVVTMPDAPDLTYGCGAFDPRIFRRRARNARDRGDRRVVRARATCGVHRCGRDASRRLTLP